MEGRQHQNEQLIPGARETLRSIDAPTPLKSTLRLPVLLFDGDCGLCNRIVRLLLQLDGLGQLRFVPLQGVNGQEFLRSQQMPLEDFHSLVFVPDWSRRHDRSFLLRTDGAIAALRACGPAGRFFAAGLSIWPEPWRDAGYRLVARWRYRLFGPWRPRPLAHAAWSERFLP